MRALSRNAIAQISCGSVVTTATAIWAFCFPSRPSRLTRDGRWPFVITQSPPLVGVNSPAGILLVRGRRRGGPSILARTHINSTDTTSRCWQCWQYRHCRCSTWGVGTTCVGRVNCVAWKLSLPSSLGDPVRGKRLIPAPTLLFCRSECGCHCFDDPCLERGRSTLEHAVDVCSATSARQILTDTSGDLDDSVQARLGAPPPQPGSCPSLGSCSSPSRNRALKIQ